MGLFLESGLLETFLLVISILWLLYHYLTKDYDFWNQRGVPCKQAAFPFGSLKDLVLGKVHLGNAYDEAYKEFPNERVFGVIEMHRPILIIKDPDLIRDILIKDFDHFMDRHAFDRNEKEWISNHLFLMDAESWRSMRQKLTPAFSSGKMKKMFTLMKKCGEQLTDCLHHISQNSDIVDVKEVLAKFTMDIIATCAFGLEINSLLNDNTEFYKVGISIFKPTTKLILHHRMLTLFPSLSQMLNINRVTSKVKTTLHSMISETVTYRQEHNVSRNDFLDILIKLKQNKSILDNEKEEDCIEKPQNNGEPQAGLTMEEITAQSFIFFAAGFETASSTMTFCLYELAKNHSIQDRLWQEVEVVLSNHGGEIDYAALQEMKYMDQVINETLRMYASLSVIHRRCTKEYRLPGSDLVLQKGQKVYIPTYAIHHDPKYYTDPYKFDPERFSPEGVKGRHPCVHLPFGSGPRNCIGMRFGLMQTKIGLATFISQFKVDVAPSTPTPIQLSPVSFVTQSNSPVYLRINRRE